MSKIDLGKKTRKRRTKFIPFETAIKEYDINTKDLKELAEDNLIQAFGLFNNDYTDTVERDRLQELQITPDTWQGRYGWEFNGQRFELLNKEDFQSFTKIRFKRKELEQAIDHEFSPNRVRARWYNWELIALQIAAYMHNTELPKNKNQWFGQIIDTIPYFKTGNRPKYEMMDEHLGIVWNALNSKEVKWDQYLRG